MKEPVLGVLVGNRGFFPDHLCKIGRETVLKVLQEEGIVAVALTPEDTTFGSVETTADAHKCADLFRQRRGELDGVLVTLPNFGDERAVANTLRWADLNIPVLVHAFPDDAGHMTSAHRRDSFCGKMSVCNNLWQFGVPYSLTALHTVAPDSEEFRQDLRRFVATCRVVRGLRGARLGALGTRPAAFITVRYSEKLLERSGISVEVLDLSEAFGRANRLKDDEAEVRDRLDEIKTYVSTRGVPVEALLKMAKFSLVVQRWMEENELVATAVQCWTAMEEHFGVVPCTVMSIMSNALLPSACETDVTGAIAMYALMLASGKPSALVDWNNNYGADPDKAVMFHCSNLPKEFFESASMSTQDIIAATVGKENTYGTIVGRIKAGPFTYCRVSTDDAWGAIRAYVGEGQVTADPLRTFGGYGVVHVPNLQGLLKYICENGFEHHVAVNPSQVAAAVSEALEKYMDWDVYLHSSS
jgi:L-fucose isomerase-like protein